MWIITPLVFILVGLQEGRCVPMVSIPTGLSAVWSLPLAHHHYGIFMFSDDCNFSVSLFSRMSWVCTQCRSSVGSMNNVCYMSSSFLQEKCSSGLVLVNQWHLDIDFEWHLLAVSKQWQQVDKLPIQKLWNLKLFEYLYDKSKILNHNTWYIIKNIVSNYFQFTCISCRWKKWILCLDLGSGAGVGGTHL